MLIDINPIQEQADELTALILGARNEFCFYGFYREDGSSFSVQFTPKELSDFLPKKKVSECIEMWEEGLQREVDLWENAVKNLEHPYWTTWKRDENGQPVEDEEGNIIEVPQKLDKRDIPRITRDILEPKRKANQKLFFKQIWKVKK